MEQKEKRGYFSPDAKCDFCNTEFRLLKVPHLYDGATVHGPWALMCSKCFSRNGKGIGQGRGQKYTWSTFSDNTAGWKKIGG